MTRKGLLSGCTVHRANERVVIILWIFVFSYIIGNLNFSQ